jgi:N utilization substance protein B
MESEQNDYQSDREVWRKLYRTLIQDNENLDTLLEDQSLYWNDDKEIVDTFVLKTIKRFEEKNGSSQELLPEYDTNEEQNYARKLFRATIMNGEEYQHYMSESSQNWDFSRLAYMDIVIMQIAIAEMLTFTSIPVSVTINEYVEIAKVYSTPRSASYINGMLDAIARHLIDTGHMLKHMNGER